MLSSRRRKLGRATAPPGCEAPSREVVEDRIIDAARKRTNVHRSGECSNLPHGHAAISINDDQHSTPLTSKRANQDRIYRSTRRFILSINAPANGGDYYHEIGQARYD